jgi:solute carrier family 8 (sodium/calcium exchanger)
MFVIPVLLQVIKLFSIFFRNESNQSDDDLGEDGDSTVKLYVVSERKLLSLFRICQQCGSRGAEANIASMNGTLVTVTQTCLSCDEVTGWNSQEMIGNYPSGNIRLSTALLCAGGIPSKTFRLLQFWGVQSFAPCTFFAHQSKFLYQAVHNIWEEESIDALASLDNVAHLSGDARSDSMGHCAKYGSYSLHDTEHNAIVWTELIVVC